MVEKKRILFTTVYNNGSNIYDHFSVNTRRILFRYSFPRTSSFGLRFIKENIPEIDILEYPSWKKFKKKLKKYDIIGFSFYLNEVPEILKMVRYARRCGKEVWAGNYGAMTPEIHEEFDRVFIGYSERSLGEILGKHIGDIKHPNIVMFITLPFGLKVNQAGILFTTRGCYNRCTFCQTPRFCPTVEKLDIASIERALVRYKRQGIKEVIIFDENFGILTGHTDRVTRLLQKHDFYWFCMTRADILKPNLDIWEKRGLIGAFVGIESFNQESLDYIKKKEDISLIEEVMAELNRRSLFTLGYYVIGFENETVKSIKRDIRRLAALKLDMNQICVITPLPMTPLWDEIGTKFGITDRNYRHYDTKHLVWKHPKISQNEMRRLLEWSFKTVYPRSRVFRTARKFIRKYRKDKGLVKGTKFLLVKLYRANTHDYGMRRGKSWGKKF